MTAPTNPPAQPDPGEDCPAATSVGGLARDLEALRRDVTGLAGLAAAGRGAGAAGHPPGRGHHRGRVDRARRRRGGVVAGRRAGPARPERRPRRCSPGSRSWVAGVYLRYPDARAARLLAVAPRGGRGTALAAPGLAGRLRRRRAGHRGGGLARPVPARRGRPDQVDYADMCALEDHQPGKIRHRPARTAPVAGRAAGDRRAGGRPSATNPHRRPAAEQIAAANQAHRNGARR